MRLAYVPTSTLNISMPPELAAYIAALVASGRYDTTSEVFRARLRLLQEKEGVPPGTLTAGSKTGTVRGEH